MNDSFLVGYARIVLAILSFYFMPTDYIVATIMYLLSGLLDAFDGHAARYFNQSESLVFSFAVGVSLSAFSRGLTVLQWS